MIIPKLKSAFICLWGIPVKIVTLGMQGGWYLFNFMVFFSLSNDKTWLGLQQKPNPACFVHTTSHNDSSRAVEEISPHLLLSKLSFFVSHFLFVSCSLVKLLFVCFQKECGTDKT